jgi:hypothetical protein
MQYNGYQRMLMIHPHIETNPLNQDNVENMK